MVTFIIDSTVRPYSKIEMHVSSANKWEELDDWPSYYSNFGMFVSAGIEVQQFHTAPDGNVVHKVFTRSSYENEADYKLEKWNKINRNV